MSKFVAKFVIAACCAVLIAAAGAPTAAAQTRVTLKSAATNTAYYHMTVQIAEALKSATQGQIQATVEESQGSVQNVKEAAKRPGAFIFTSPPGLVQSAVAGKKPFEGESGYDAIRALFVMPAITMHWVVRADAGVRSFADLAGKDFVAGGRGTFSERQTIAVFKLLGLEGKVKLVEVELAAAFNAVRNRQVSGFATGSSHPTPNLQELAAGTPIRLLGLTAEQIELIRAEDPSAFGIVIPKGTYRGVDDDIRTISLPVGAYGTARMDDATAHAITKTFWTSKAEMARANPWWSGVGADQIALLGGKLHPGASKYYAEAGIAVPDGMK